MGWARSRSRPAAHRRYRHCRWMGVRARGWPPRAVELGEVVGAAHVRGCERVQRGRALRHGSASRRWRDNAGSSRDSACQSASRGHVHCLVAYARGRTILSPTRRDAPELTDWRGVARDDLRMQRLVLVSGPTGTGKSVLANAIVSDLLCAVDGFDYLMSALRSISVVWQVVELPVERQWAVGWSLLTRLAEQEASRASYVGLGPGGDHPATGTPSPCAPSPRRILDLKAAGGRYRPGCRRGRRRSRSGCPRGHPTACDPPCSRAP
jgi:hypothetical protein